MHPLLPFRHASFPALLLEESILAPNTLWNWDNWSWELGIVLPLVLLLGIYVAGAVRRGNASPLAWRHVSFAFGWLTLFLSLVSPLHELGEQLFSAHMLQHELLILIAAPLITAAHPGVTCLWAFSGRGRIGLGGLYRDVSHARWVRLLMAPLAAWLIHAVALWGWHLPALYQATLRSDWIHALQHLSFFQSALLFWSALYGIGRSAMRYGAGVLYVFGTAVHCSALGALLTFSSVLWYPIYADSTLRWSLTPLEDQQLGGLLMWVPSGVVFIAISLLMFTKWLAESDRRLGFGQLHTVMHDTGGINE
jgi:putative membrane protein